MQTFIFINFEIFFFFKSKNKEIEVHIIIFRNNTKMDIHNSLLVNDIEKYETILEIGLVSISNNFQLHFLFTLYF